MGLGSGIGLGRIALVGLGSGYWFGQGIDWWGWDKGIGLGRDSIGGVGIRVLVWAEG